MREVDDAQPCYSKASGDQINEIIQSRDEVKYRNADLKVTLAALRDENRAYKSRHQLLSQRLKNVNELLERNVGIFRELFDNSKNALQLGRASVLTSPLSQHNNSKSVLRDHPKPGPSGTTVTRRKLHIERLNLKELEQSLEDEQDISEKKQTEESEPLHTVVEENSSNKSFDVTDPKHVLREVCVRLTRLPCEVVEQHLKKFQNVTESSLDITASFSRNLDPEITSTPLKLETMRQLGLYPSALMPPKIFVNTRRKFDYNIRKSPLIKKRSSMQNNEPSTNNEITINHNNKNIKRSPSKGEKSPVQVKKLKIENSSPGSSNINYSHDNSKNVKKSPLKAEKSLVQSNSLTSGKSEIRKKSRILNPEVVLRSPKTRRAKPMDLKEPSLGKKLRRE